MKIYLNYSEILENSEMLLKITEEYDKIIENIKKSCNNINEAWISENKEIELEHFNELIKNLKINNNYYKLFANIIKNVREDFQLLEQEASKYMILDNIDTNEVKI